MRANADITQIGDDLPSIKNALVQLISDFQSHNHDGSSSTAFQTARADTFVSRSLVIRKTSFADTSPGLWVGVINDTAKFNLGSSTDFIKFDGNNLTIKVTNSNIKLYEAIVDAAGNGDYLTVKAAIDAGKTRIFVRNGTYTNEGQWSITNANTTIVGESYGGVDITFANNAKEIYVQASNCYFERLKLTSYTTSTNNLFVFSVAGLTPTIFKCLLRNDNGVFFEGGEVSAGLFGTFKDNYLNLQNVASNTNVICFNNIDESIIHNCLVDDTTNAVTGVQLLASSNNSVFTNCLILNSASGATMTVVTSPTCAFDSCIFSIQEVVMDAKANNCQFITNGNGSTGHVVIIGNNQNGIVFTNNYVKSGLSDGNFRCNGSDCIMTSNYFDQGASIQITPNSARVGCIFSNNIWKSAYTTAAITLTINSSMTKAIVHGNILRNSTASFTPVITDNGVSTLFASGTYNQLISG